MIVENVISEIKRTRSVNGTGLVFVGECDYEEDGSYTSTCWICIFGFPILPLYSARILDITGNFFLADYQFTKLPRIKWMQVFRTWVYMLLYPIGIFIMILIHVMSRGSDSTVFRLMSWVCVLGTPIMLFALPTLLRIRAAKAVGLELDTGISKTGSWMIGVLFLMLIILIALY